MNILCFFNDYEDMDDLLSKPLVKESMFTTWLLAKKPYIKGKNLTYLQFVWKFVYVLRKRALQPRKKSYTVGILNWVPPIAGELYYLKDDVVCG